MGYSGIIPFVYDGKEEIHKYMQYEVSMHGSHFYRLTNFPDFSSIFHSFPVLFKVLFLI